MPVLQTSSLLLEAGTNEVELIEFYLGKESYGINVSKVLRVIARREAEITPLADSHPAIMGITHIQDNPVPVIDLRKALNVSDAPNNSERQLLLVLQFNQTVTSYIIDGINKIHRTTWQNFKPVTQNATGSKGYINGTVRVDDHVILFLDVEHLQNEIAPAQQISLDEEFLDPALKSKRAEVPLLYVEDSPIVRRQTATALASAGFSQLHVVENGSRALAYIQQLQKRAEESKKSIRTLLSAVVTDIEMPEMDGLTLCKTLKTQIPRDQAPDVFIYSSLINEQMQRKCKSVKADAAINKPAVDRLIQELDKAFMIG